MEADEITHPEKKNNTAETAVGKVWKKMKADFPEAYELQEEVRRQESEWKT